MFPVRTLPDVPPHTTQGGRHDSNSAGGRRSGDGSTADDMRVLRVLDLAKFDEKIHFYLGVQTEVASLRHVHDVGFVRVNAQPMRQALRYDSILSPFSSVAADL